MAVSPSHRFGQIIGEVLEGAFEPLLSEFAAAHNLYLDKKGVRNTRRGTKVSWTDSFGNSHDLDLVLERNGTADRLGTPVAFIEIAWRRYTKHSRNKVQEIQGAIMPLVAAYHNAAPFFGAVLGGVFTEGALKQLGSLGFRVLYVPFDVVIAAFEHIGIDARFDEDTPEEEFGRKIAQWNMLSPVERLTVGREIVKLTEQQTADFMRLLQRSVIRGIESVRILPLHGRPEMLNTVDEAIAFIEQYDEITEVMPITRYEIVIRYDSGDHIDGYFDDRESATEFLRSYQAPVFRPTDP